MLSSTPRLFEAFFAFYTHFPGRLFDVPFDFFGRNVSVAGAGFLEKLFQAFLRPFRVNSDFHYGVIRQVLFLFESEYAALILSLDRGPFSENGYYLAYTGITD